MQWHQWDKVKKTLQKTEIIEINARPTKVVKVINLQFPMEILCILNSIFFDTRLIFNKIY